jgi:hypothetical protein
MGKHRSGEHAVTSGVDGTIGAALALTDAVQEAINAGDWRAASKLEADRREALELIVASGVAGGSSHKEIESLLLAARDRSRRLIGEVDHHRRRLLREAQMIGTGQKAVDQYESTAEYR